MMVAAADDREGPSTDWNPEGDDLSFLRDEGLELLALYKKISDKKRRRLVLELIKTFAEQEQSNTSVRSLTSDD